jgi:hypothetical protein
MFYAFLLEKGGTMAQDEGGWENVVDLKEGNRKAGVGRATMMMYSSEAGNPLKEVVIDGRELMSLYGAGKFDVLSEKLMAILGLLSMRENTYLHRSSSTSSFINSFVQNFLYLMSREDFVIPEKHAQRYILLNHPISNLIAMSEFKNSDRELRILLGQKNNVVKVLTLLSRRNEIRIDLEALFKASAPLASLWYWGYYVGSIISKGGLDNIRYHMAQIEKIGGMLTGLPVGVVTGPYFRATYADPNGDRPVKERVNELIKRSLKSVRVENNPKNDQIAVITGKWFPESSVYRPQYRYLQALKENYQLTLVHLGPRKEGIDGGMFKEVRHVAIDGRGRLDLSAVIKNDFMVAYFPDVGMLPESIYLSNLRLAPIQVTTYGHPVSTFGSEIDYFLGGVDAEIAEKAQDNYSERLILLPGVGQFPVYPQYTAEGMEKSKKEFVISCPWSGQKINYPMLQNLREIRDRANRTVMFRFFTGGDFDRWNLLVPSVEEIADVLGQEHIEVFPAKAYRDYMASIEEADISLDSFPFGGYNTMVDALFLKKPVITFEGDKAYNRFASSLLKRSGLQELVARSDAEYIAKAVKLINDDTYRQDIVRRVLELDLEGKIFETDETGAFTRAMDYLIEHHRELQEDVSRHPIVIDGK